jgi:hypothetical protein
MNTGALAGGFRIVPQHFREFVGKGERLMPDPFKDPLPRIYSRELPTNSTTGL